MSPGLSSNSTFRSFTIMESPTQPGSKILNSYFDFNRFILKACGVWMPKEDDPNKTRQYIINFALLFYSIFLYMPAEASYLFQNWSLSLFVRGFRDMLNHIMCLGKLFTWFRHRKEILKIMDDLQNSQFLYEEPSLLFKEASTAMEKPSFVVKSEEPTVFIKEPTTLFKVSNILKKESNILKKESNVLRKEPTILMKEPTLLMKEPTILMKESTILIKQPSLSTENTLSMDELKSFSPEKILKHNKKKADIWMKVFLIGVNSICINMSISVLYVMIFNSKDNYVLRSDGKTVYSQELPVHIRLPFERDTKIAVFLAFLFEIIALDAFAWIIVGLDTLFTSLMSCVTAHFIILQGALKTIRQRCFLKFNIIENDSLYDSELLRDAMSKEMGKCVNHLQFLIQICEKIESIYNIQTCGQVIISLLEMCFCLFLLSSVESPFDESFGPEFTYLFSTTFELLLYCWFGNEVTESSIGIPLALYEGDWLSAGTTYKKNMLITMIRMKRPIRLTIGKFSPLAFTTFLSIGRVAYSFFTVLKSNALK